MGRITSMMATLVGRQGFMRAQAGMDRALERLATGKRINRASDDPSGLIAADKLAVRRVTIDELIKQSEYVSAMLDVAEGAYAEIATLAEDLNGLVVAAANRAGTSQGEREAMQIEANGIIAAMNHIMENTVFDGKKILIDGHGQHHNGHWIAVSSMTLHRLGSVSREVIDPNGKVRTVTHTLDDIRNGALNLVDGDMEQAQALVGKVVNNVAFARGRIGNDQKYTYGRSVDALRLELENTIAAESAIREADFAQEISTLVRSEVLREASIDAIKIGQQQAQKALSLLG